MVNALLKSHRGGTGLEFWDFTIREKATRYLSPNYRACKPRIAFHLFDLVTVESTKEKVATVVPHTSFGCVCTCAKLEKRDK